MNLLRARAATGRTILARALPFFAALAALAISAVGITLVVAGLHVYLVQEHGHAVALAVTGSVALAAGACGLVAAFLLLARPRGNGRAGASASTAADELLASALGLGVAMGGSELVARQVVALARTIVLNAASLSATRPSTDTARSTAP